MKMVLSEKYSPQGEQILELIRNFEAKGKALNDQQRNSIKIYELEGEVLNIKSFKIPNLVNKVAYKFIRKSKAQRSFEYAQYLLSKNVGTPQPVGYFEESSTFAFLKSFYVSQQLDCDLTFRELVDQPDFPEHEEILRAFTRFTYDLHEKRIEFLDHSPGNTLIMLKGDTFDFFLVDLNRMNFRDLDFDSRMKNFARLTPKEEMVRIMSKEYARLINKSEQEVFERMWFYTQEFQEKFRRKRQLKKKIKFWKK